MGIFCNLKLSLSGLYGYRRKLIIETGEEWELATISGKWENDAQPLPIA